MQLCHLCDRPLPATGPCACLQNGKPCAATSAFGTAMAAAPDREEPMLSAAQLHTRQTPAAA